MESEIASFHETCHDKGFTRRKLLRGGGGGVERADAQAAVSVPAGAVQQIRGGAEAGAHGGHRHLWLARAAGEHPPPAAERFEGAAGLQSSPQGRTCGVQLM